MIRDMGVQPESILVFTFTNRAAGEIQERLRNQMGKETTDRLYAGTFHSWGSHFLRENAQLAGLSEEFTICDQEESIGTVRMAMEQTSHPEINRPRAPQQIHNSISHWKSQGREPEDILKRWRVQLRDKSKKKAKQALQGLVYEEYEAILRSNNAVDFEDLINLPLKILRHNPATLKALQEKIEHIIVDEYQDTSRNQHELTTTIINKLNDSYPSIFIVGDTDQAIYAFRNADIRNLTQFKENDYEKAREIHLNDNYRSSPEIVNASQCLIEHNTERIKRTSRNVRPSGPPLEWFEAEDPQDEAAQIAERIQESIRRGNQYHDHCIAYRTNPQSRPVEDALKKYNIPYFIVGNSEFYNRTEVRRYLDYMSLAINWKNRHALSRILNVPKRGITQTTINVLEEYSHIEDVALRTAVSGVPKHWEKEVKEETNTKLRELDATLKKLEQMNKDQVPIKDYVDFISFEIGLRNYFEGLQDGGQRIPNIVELEQIADETTDTNLAEFLENTVIKHDYKVPQNKRVTVTTIHQTKGLEFPSVFVAGVEEGLIPHYRSTDMPPEVEEERRLMYVAMTRAEQNLTLSWCKNRPNNNPNQPDKPEQSRFLYEIPDLYWLEPPPMPKINNPLRY